MVVSTLKAEPKELASLELKNLMKNIVLKGRTGPRLKRIALFCPGILKILDEA